MELVGGQKQHVTPTSGQRAGISAVPATPPQYTMPLFEPGSAKGNILGYLKGNSSRNRGTPGLTSPSQFPNSSQTTPKRTIVTLAGGIDRSAALGLRRRSGPTTPSRSPSARAREGLQDELKSIGITSNRGESRGAEEEVLGRGPLDAQKVSQQLNQQRHHHNRSASYDFSSDASPVKGYMPDSNPVTPRTYIRNVSPTSGSASARRVAKQLDFSQDQEGGEGSESRNNVGVSRSDYEQLLGELAEFKKEIATLRHQKAGQGEEREGSTDMPLQLALKEYATLVGKEVEGTKNGDDGPMSLSTRQALLKVIRDDVEDLKKTREELSNYILSDSGDMPTTDGTRSFALVGGAHETVGGLQSTLLGMAVAFALFAVLVAMLYILQHSTGIFDKLLYGFDRRTLLS